MADHHLVCNFEGDYGLKLLTVDENSTMKQVATRAADLLAGVVVPQITDRSLLRVRVQGQDKPLASNITVAEAGLIELETIEIYKETDRG